MLFNHLDLRCIHRFSNKRLPYFLNNKFNTYTISRLCTMICQQLTTVCIVMTTYKIASGQLSFQRLSLSPQTVLSYGMLRRPPNGYHYETRRHILNTYPRNSYTIRNGLANVVRNNNRGSSSPSKRRKKNPKKEKSDDEDEGETPADDDTSSPSGSPSGGSSTDPNLAPPGGQSSP